MEAKGASGSDSHSVSPPILVVFRPVSCIICYYAAPSQNQQGVYIASLSQDDFVEVKIAAIGPTRQKMGPTTWFDSWPAW
jgi:hypothetical protein